MQRMADCDAQSQKVGKCSNAIEHKEPELKACNCKRSNCLKLYCDCFAVGAYCSPKRCNCLSCFNNVDNESQRNAAVTATLERNPNAFRSKVVEEEKFAHHKGCHCKRSHCLKKYCECFQSQILCTEKCRCQDCKNRVNNPDHLKINGDETRTEDEDSSSHFSIQALDPLLERFSLVVNKTSIERICMEMVEALTTADPPPVASPKRKRTDASTGHLADEEKVLGVFCSSLSAIVQEHLSSQAAAAGSRSGLDTAMAPFVSAQSKTMPHSTFPTIAGALEQPVKLMVGTSDVVSLSQDTQLSQASLYQDSLLSHDALLSQDSWPSILSNEGDAWIGSQATFNSCESVKASGTSDSPTTWSTYQDQSEGRTIHPTSDDSDKCDTSAPVGGHLPVEVCSEPEGAMETYGLSHVQTQSSTMTQDEAGCFAGTSDASLSSSLPTVIASGEFYILPTEHAAIALGPYSQSHPNTTPMEESPMTFHPPIHHPTDSTLGHSFSFPYFQPQSEVASCNISSHDSPSGLNSVNHSEAPVNEENTGNHNVDASQPLSEGSASSPQAPLDIPLEKLQQILQTKPDVCSHIQMILGDETLTNEDKEAAVNRIIMSLHVADEKSLPSQSVWSV